MRFEYCPGNPLKLAADFLVIGVFEGAESGPSIASADAALGGHLKTHIKEEEFKATEGAQIVLHTHGKITARKIALIGLGKPAAFDEERLRRASGRSFRAAVVSKAKRVVLQLPFEKAGGTNQLQTLLEGLLLASYDFSRYKKTEGKRAIETATIVSRSAIPSSKTQAAEWRARAYAEASMFARDLVNTPALDMTPKHLVEEATRTAIISKKRVRMKVYGREDLLKMGCGGILAVAQGSQHEPYLLHLTYRPVKKSKKRIVLVGKGVTFDSGGLSLKPAEGMMDMKIDMAGAAAVLAVFKALPQLMPAVEVHGITALVENMPSGTAIRPGDIVRTMSGKTIEILNTDAEGRVTLADSLYYGSKLKPDFMIDLATLTGACMAALGHDYAGLMSTSPKLTQRLMEASNASGEPLWELPLPEDYVETVKSKHADLKNITGGRYGGAITAGLFLKEFVGETPWAHLDIAGPAYNERDYPDYRAWGASGFGARLLLEFLLSF